MSPVKLLVVIDEMEVGGSQRQVTNLLTKLDRAKFAPTLAFFRNRSFLVDQIEAAGVGTRYLPKTGAIDPRFYVALARLLKRARYDVIHAWGFTAELWTCLARIWAPGSALISSVRGKYAEYQPWQWQVKRWVTWQSIEVVSNSKIAGDYCCQQIGRPDGSYRVIYNGIERPGGDATLPPDLQLLRQRYDWVVTFVGRLGPEKNVPCLLRAVHRLQQRGGDRIGVWLVGDGPERAALAAMVDQLQLCQVHLLGERRDIAALLRHSDVAVLPSRWEGVSNALLEAMAVGLPVVASAVGGTPEVVEHERNGLLFPSDDDDAFAAALLRLYRDRDGAQRLGRAGAAAVADRFSVASMVRQHEALYLDYARRLARGSSATAPAVPSGHVAGTGLPSAGPGGVER